MTNEIITLKSGDHIAREDLITKIAVYIFVTASKETQNSSWVIHADEIYEYFDIDFNVYKDLYFDISTELVNLFGNMIGDISIGNYAFDIVLYHNYCCGYIEDDQAIIENQ